MKIRNILIFTLTILFAPVSNADNFKIDAAHSTIQFTANHLGFSHLIGRFNNFSGGFSLEKDTTKNTAMVSIDTSSVDTNHQKRDDHLRSPDFFNAKEFPTMDFKSLSYKGNAKEGVLTGNLTLLGVTKKVDFKVKSIGEGKDPWGGYRAGFNATATIDRTDFGMNFMAPTIPVNVMIKLFIEGIKQ